MRKIILTAISILVMLASFVKDSATLTTRSGVSSGDLQTILYFEGISFQKFKIKSDALKGRDYQIIIKEFKDGRNVLAKNGTATIASATATPPATSGSFGRVSTFCRLVA